MLAIKNRQADNQTFTSGEQKVIEESLDRIAAALEFMVRLKMAQRAEAALAEPKQKAGPGRPRKYPKPDEGVAAAAPAAADQPVESEATIAGNDRGAAPKASIPPPDVVVHEPAGGVDATPAADVTPEPSPEPSPEPTPEPSPEPAPAKTVGEDDIREAMIELRRVRNRDGVMEILAKFGVKGVGELDPASFPDVIKAVEAAIA
jgi:hypothetical protein